MGLIKIPLVRALKQGNAKNIKNKKKITFHFILFPSPKQSVKQKNCEFVYHVTVYKEHV